MTCSRFGLFAAACAALAIGCGDDATEPGDVTTADTTTPDGDVTQPSDTDTSIPQVTCDDPIPAVPSGEVCAVVAGNDQALLIRADILRPDGIQERSQVLVVDGLIACVGCDCAATSAAAGATVFNCPDALVSPGLINAHDHITFDQHGPVAHGTTRWDHRNEYRNGANQKPKLAGPSNADALGVAWTELRQVLAGETSVFGSGSAQGFLRNLDVSAQLGGLQHGAADYETFPLDDSDGIIRQSGCGDYSLPRATIADGKVAYAPHVAEGVSLGARNELVCLDGEGEGSVDVTGPNVAFVHGIGVTTADIARLVGANTKLIWSPRSNTDLYGFTAPAPLYHRLGGQVALGTDWTTTGSANILRELRCAQDWNARWNHTFSDQQLVNMVTSWAASALGFGDVIGALTVGRVADLVIWDAREHAGLEAILDAGSEDVALVLRGGPPLVAGSDSYYHRGRPLYGDVALVAALSDRQLDYADYDPAVYSPSDGTKKTLPPPCEVVEVCGATKSLCVAEQMEAEASASDYLETMTLAELRAALDAAKTYDIFVCGAPADEPSCVPARAGEFTGVPSAADPDGDGLSGGDDDCPEWFNAVRPMDGGAQPDSDDDGLGDVCDPCPLDKDTSACTSRDPDDLDGDGVIDTSDNCPTDRNGPADASDQVDADGDGIGDVCDACKDISNLGGRACPSTIAAAKQGGVAAGEVLLQGVVCVVVGKDFYTVQTRGAASPEYAGVYVFTGTTGAKCAPGDVIDVQGTIADFLGQVQLSNSTFVKTLDSAPVAVPEPFVVDPADIAPGGAKIAALEAVLVEVRDVSVTSLTPTPDNNELVANEFVVSGGLSVDDLLYLVTPYPAIGTAYTAIRGLTLYQKHRIKLLPRSRDDYTEAP